MRSWLHCNSHPLMLPTHPPLAEAEPAAPAEPPALPPPVDDGPTVTPQHCITVMDDPDTEPESGGAGDEGSDGPHPTTVQAYLVRYASAINKSKSGKVKRRPLPVPVPTALSLAADACVPQEASRVMAARRARRRLLQLERMLVIPDRRGVPAMTEVLGPGRLSLIDAYAPPPIPADSPMALRSTGTPVGASELSPVPVKPSGSPAAASTPLIPPATPVDPRRRKGPRDDADALTLSLRTLLRPALIAALLQGEAPFPLAFVRSGVVCLPCCVSVCLCACARALCMPLAVCVM